MSTRVDVERILIRRCGRKMVAASMDGETDSGANDDLNDPIGCALRAMGYSVRNIAQVSDSDLSGVSIEEYDELFDRAELRTLENIAGNLDLVDISIGPRRESLAQLSSQVERAIERLQARINTLYGDSGEFEAGAISLDFQAKDDD